MYLRRAGWTYATTFSIQTAAGEIRPTITGETTRTTVDMGRAKPLDEEPCRRAAEWRYQHMTIG